MPLTPPPPIKNKFFTPRAFNAIDHTPNRYHSLYVHRHSSSDSDSEAEEESLHLPSDLDDSSDIEDYIVVKQPDPKVPPSDDITLASYNLQSYLQCVVLPRMHVDMENAAYSLKKPPPPLESREDGITMLGKIRKNEFKDCIRLYNAYGIYTPEDFPFFRTGIGRPLNPETEALCLEAKVNNTTVPPESTIPELPQPISLEDVTTWVVNGPLKTAQRALHLSNFGTRQWSFEKTSSLAEHLDRNAIFVWKFHPETVEEGNQELEKLNFGVISKDRFMELTWTSVPPPNMKLAEKTLAVIIEPPWATTLSHLRQIYLCQPPVISYSYSYNLAPPQPAPLGPIWDPFEARLKPAAVETVSAWMHAIAACKQLGTEYFVITTYEGWIFGKFGGEKDISSMANISAEALSRLTQSSSTSTRDSTPEGISWTTCQVTDVFKYNTCQPTMVQALTFWIARSMHLDYTDVLPLKSSAIRLPNNHVQPLLPLFPLLDPPPPPVIEISRPDRMKTARPHPQLPSGLPIPITQGEETRARENPRYLEDLETLGLASFPPEVILAEFHARVEEYFASDYNTRNASLNIRPLTKP